MSLAEILKDWWQFGVFVLTAAFGFFIGVQRRQYHIADLQRRLGQVEDRLKKVEDKQSLEAVSMARIEAKLDGLHDVVGRLADAVSGKADK